MDESFERLAFDVNESKQKITSPYAQQKRSSSGLLEYLKSIIAQSSDSSDCVTAKDSLTSMKRKMSSISAIDSLAIVNEADLSKLIQDIEAGDDEMELYLYESDSDLSSTWKSLESLQDEINDEEKQIRSIRIKPGRRDESRPRMTSIEEQMRGFFDTSVDDFQSLDSILDNWEKSSSLSLTKEHSDPADSITAMDGFLGYRMFRSWSGPNESDPDEAKEFSKVHLHTPIVTEEMEDFSSGRQRSSARSGSVFKPVSIIGSVINYRRYSSCHSKLLAEPQEAPVSWKILLDFSDIGNVYIQSFQKECNRQQMSRDVDLKLFQQLFLLFRDIDHISCCCTESLSVTANCRVYAISSLRLRGLIPFVASKVSQLEYQSIAVILLLRLSRTFLCHCRSTHGVLREWNIVEFVPNLETWNHISASALTITVLFGESIGLEKVVEECLWENNGASIEFSILSQSVLSYESFLILLKLMRNMKDNDIPPFLSHLNVLLTNHSNVKLVSDSKECFECILHLAVKSATLFNDPKSIGVVITIISKIMHQILYETHSSKHFLRTLIQMESDLYEISKDTLDAADVIRLTYYSLLSRVGHQEMIDSTPLYESPLLTNQFVLLERLQEFLYFPKANSLPLNVYNGCQVLPDKILVDKLCSLLSNAKESGVMGQSKNRTSHFDSKQLQKLRLQMNAFDTFFRDIKEYMEICSGTLDRKEDDVLDLVFSLSLKRERGLQKKRPSVIHRAVMKSIGNAGSISVELLEFLDQFKRGELNIKKNPENTARMFVQRLLKV